MADRPAAKPDARAYVIGDIHGAIQQLSVLLQKIDEEMRDNAGRDTELVFVGDYVDRGPNSAGVLTFLYEMSKANSAQVTCILGNHEAMLLDFLANPIGPAKDWLRYGGRETMQSFGITVPEDIDALRPAEMHDIAGALRGAMGGLMLSWLKGLPLAWRSGNVWAVHAGADPFVPMEDQTSDALLWGHKDFNKVDRSDGQWVVVGHQVVEYPRARRGKIQIDTGAVYGGPLTALCLVPGEEPRYLQALPNERSYRPADRSDAAPSSGG